MESIRYYYGARYKVAQVPMLLDENNEFCGVCGDFKPISNTPRVTICSIYNNETNEVAFGVARCSKCDEFVKKIGRETALERAKNAPYKTISVTDKRCLNGLVMEEFRRIENEIYDMHYPIKVNG